VQDLLDVNDPDWQSFSSTDPQYYLRVAGATIRTYCGWHIYPSLTVTADQLAIGARGLIMLPSRHVTAVDSVVLFAGSGDPWTLNPDTDYRWFAGGWIEQTSYPLWGWNYGAYYYGPDGPAFPAGSQAGYAQVGFTHGYPAVPEDIKQVAFELANWAIQVNGASGGNVKEIASPGFRLVVGTSSGGASLGMNLSTDQKSRLANYRIGGAL